MLTATSFESGRSDEFAGNRFDASTSDDELSFAAGLLLRRLDPSHVRRRRSAAAPLDHGVDALRVALERRLHTAVRHVSHEAADPAGRRFVAAIPAKAHALDVSGDEYANPLHCERTTITGRFADVATRAYLYGATDPLTFMKGWRIGIRSVTPDNVSDDGCVECLM